MRLVMLLTTVLMIGCGSKGDSSAPAQSARAHQNPAPVGTYSPNQISTCTGGDCACMPAINPCPGIPVFGDVTIYSWTSATFYNSITETVDIDEMTGKVTLTSNTTGHLGFSFFVSPAQQLGRWKIIFGESCCRLYDKVF